MDNFSRRNRVMQALEMNTNGTIGQNVQAKTEVSQNAIVSRRLHVLHEWQAARRDLIAKVFGLVEEIEMLEKKSSNSAKKSDFQRSETLSPSSSKKEKKTRQMPHHIRTLMSLTDGEMVTLGPNGTQIRREVISSMNWSLSNANITRKILMELFDRNTLATHTLSGKPSPAFVGCNKPKKMQLHPQVVEDIIYALTNSLDMTEKDVRQAITTKCADENKMYRQREERRQGIVKRRRKSEIKY